MTVDRRLQDALAQLSAARQEDRDRERLKGGGGSGTSGGMEERIARLETHMEHIVTDVRRLATLPEQFARLDERVAHLPSKTWIFTVLTGMLAAFSGIVGLLIHFLPHAAP